jgi:hypothetical protein
MGKIKNKKPDSWKPSPTIQKDGFVSKNKKRKEKRMQEKLVAERTEAGDFIPVRKNALKPLQVSGLSGKKQLSTSLPIKSGKKVKRDNPNNSMVALTARNAGVETSKKVGGILSNPNTPKRNKNERVTFALDKKTANAKKFLDDEAEECEEPIVNKVVKPYEKKGLNKKPQVHSSDESEDEEDDDESVEAEDFLDMEASEGEETDDDEDDDNTDADDSDESDDSSDENTYLSSFINDGSDEDEDDSDEDEDEDDSDEDEDDEPAPKLKLNRKEEKKNEIPTPSKAKKSVDPAPPTKKVNPPTPSKSITKTEELDTPTPAKLKGKPAEVATPSKHEKNVENEKQKKKQKKSDDDVEVKAANEDSATKSDKPSSFIGFIRRLPIT